MAKFTGKDFLVQLLNSANATAWTATTAYVVGQLVTNGANTYRCTVAGTSAGAGGPTGTATTPVVDGSCSWVFYGVSINYTTVGGMRSTSMTINNEQVDVTDKGDVPWRQLLACGIKSMDLSLSGFFTDQVTLNTILACLASSTSTSAIQQFKLVSGRGDSVIGLFQITSCERSGEYNQAEQYSLSLASAAAISYTAA